MIPCLHAASRAYRAGHDVCQTPHILLQGGMLESGSGQQPPPLIDRQWTRNMSETSTTEAPTSEAPVIVTHSAATRVCEIMSDEPEGSMLRISVEGGGCSGFQYKYDLVQNRDADDLVLEREGATILIDQMSLQFLSGSEIDYVDDLIGAAFKINNPNATAGCGCGTSFSI